MYDKPTIQMNNQVSNEIDRILGSKIDKEIAYFTRNSIEAVYDNDIDSDLSIEMQIKTIEMLALIKQTSPQEAYNKMERDSYSSQRLDGEDDSDDYFFFDDDDSLFEPIYINSENEDRIEYNGNNDDISDEEIFGMEL